MRRRAPRALGALAVLGSLASAAYAHPPSEHPPDDGGELGYSPATAPQGGSFETWGRCPPIGEEMEVFLRFYKVSSSPGSAAFSVDHHVDAGSDHTWRHKIAVPADAPAGSYKVSATCYFDDHPKSRHEGPFGVTAAAPPPTAPPAPPTTTTTGRPTPPPAPPTTAGPAVVAPEPTTPVPTPATGATTDEPTATVGSGAGGEAAAAPTGQRKRSPAPALAAAGLLVVAASAATVLPIRRGRRLGDGGA